MRVRDDLNGERITPAIEVTAYFIVSEALANVAKHATAAEATVTLARQDDDLIVDVSDDGVGGASAAEGTGLRGLQDRVDAYAGHLHIHSVAGQGTRLTAGAAMRVVIADDATLFREGVATLLGQSDIDVVGQARDAMSSCPWCVSRNRTS